MAKKVQDNINIAKINKANRNISRNINGLMDNIYSSVRGKPKQSEIDDLNSQFNDILKTDLGIMTDKADGDVTDFITKMFSSSQKNHATFNKQLTDIFNMSENQIESFLSEAYQNRLVKQHDIHEVATQLNELREAILITRDSIVSSDVVDGHMSRTLSFENAGSIENADEYIPIIEKTEKTFKLKEKIKNFIIPRTLEYGEYYAYVIPYSKIFDDFSIKKQELGANFMYNESTLYDLCHDDVSKHIFENVSSETKKRITDGQLTKKAVTETMMESFKNISISNEATPLMVLDEGVESIDVLLREHANSTVTEKKTTTSGFYKVNNHIDGSGIISDKKLKSKSEFEDIKDCYVKLIDPMHLIPVKIMDYVIGYYYIHETEVSFNNKSISYGLYDGNHDKSNIIEVISNEIVKSFDKKFLNDNIKFKSLIVEALQYFNFNDRKIKFQYIPKEYIVTFKINEDENGDGVSIVEPALFYAKLYLMLLLFKMVSIVSYSNDTRVHYIRQSGIDKNVINKIQEIARKIQNRQVNMIDMFSYTSLVNKVANGNDRFVPVGRSGERGIETEILSGQDIPLNTELMEMLKSSYISATGVPAVIMNYINEADYAKTLELANTRYQARIVSNQLDFNASITEFYQKILRYSTNIPEAVVEQFTFSFAPPRYANSNVTSDLMGTFGAFAEFMTSLLFTDEEVNDANNAETIRMFKLKLAKERLPSVNIDRCLELKKEAEVDGIKESLAKQNTQR